MPLKDYRGGTQGLYGIFIEKKIRRNTYPTPHTHYRNKKLSFYMIWFRKTFLDSVNNESLIGILGLNLVIGTLAVA